MNCTECHRVLPESLEGQRNAELEAHLASCAACSELVADLRAITREAALLQEADEPSPRVWNMIEAELRREGVIHPPQPRRSWLPALGGGWRPVAWGAPIAAALIATALFLLNPRTTSNSDQAAQTSQPPAMVKSEKRRGSNATPSGRPADTRCSRSTGAVDESILRRQPLQRECLHS